MVITTILSVNLCRRGASTNITMLIKEKASTNGKTILH